MKKSLLLIAMLVLLPIRWVFPLDLGMAKEDAGQPGAFLDYGASARSLAMGRAFTGIADDASAGYWNPSGLTQLDRKNLVTLYSMQQMDTGYGFIGFAVPTIDYGTFGVNLVSLTSGEFEKRREGDGAKVGIFSQADTAVLLSHGYILNSRWSIGETIKMINQRIDAERGTGYGADVGILWRAHSRIQTGLMAKNVVAPRIKLREVPETYPRQIGIGFKFMPVSRWILSTDVSQTEYRSVKLNIGSEWQVKNGLALRAGVNETEISAGLGIKFEDWSLDYAMGYHQSLAGVEGLGVSQRLGFSWSFGTRVAETGFSQRWQRKGQVALEVLRNSLNADPEPTAADMQKVVLAAQEAVDRNGYYKAADLFMAQGYITYFKGEYERSVQSLSEALAHDPGNRELKAHLNKARAKMTEVQTKKMVAIEMKLMKELYRSGDFQAAAVSGRKILAVSPDNVEASAYLDDVERRINEPIIRELKIASTKFEREEFLDAIKHLNLVKQMDPQNTEADKLMIASIKALERKAVLQVKTHRPVLDSGKAKVYEIRSNPNESRKLYSQGLISYSQGRLVEAGSLWERAVKVDPENQLARNAFNRVQVELQETQNP